MSKFHGAGQVKYLTTGTDSNNNKDIVMRPTEKNQGSKYNTNLSDINLELVHEINMNQKC